MPLRKADPGSEMIGVKLRLAFWLAQDPLHSCTKGDPDTTVMMSIQRWV